MHPTCNNCRKSKRECLGYDPIFKQQQQQPPGVSPAPEHHALPHGAQTPQTPQPQQQPSQPTPHQAQGHLEERYFSYNNPVPFQQLQTGQKDAGAQALPSVTALSETNPHSSNGIDPSVLGPATIQGFGHPLSSESRRPPLGPAEPMGSRQPGAGEPMAGRSLSGGDRSWGDRHHGLGPEPVERSRAGVEADGYALDAARGASRNVLGGDQRDRGLRGVPS